MAFEVVLSNQPADLLRREAEIAVRMVRPKRAALVARRVGAVRLGLYAHPDYLAAHGWPASLAALKDHAFIGFDRDPGGAEALGGFAETLRPEQFAYRTDDQAAQLAAIRAGFGIGVCQVALARRPPQLERLLPTEVSFGLETWVTMHEDLRASARLQAVFNHLAEVLIAYVKEGG